MKRIFFIPLLAVAITGFSQTVNNKLSFQPGQKLEIVTDTKKTSSLELMGQKMETAITSTLTESYDIQKTGAEGTIIEYKVKRLVCTISGGMAGNQSFDSDKEGDRKGEIGKLLEKGLKNKYTMTVDEYGKVTAVKADDDNPNGKAKDENEAMLAMISTQLGFSYGVPKVGDASIFKFLPKEIAKNDTWTDSSSANGQKKQTIYKVSNVDDASIVLDYYETVDVDATQEMMGTQAKVKSTDKTTGQITLDRKTGLLKQKTAAGDNAGTMEGQGMTIPSSGKTTTTITVKTL